VTEPEPRAGPSAKAIQGRLAKDVATGTRSLRKLGARRLLASRHDGRRPARACPRHVQRAADRAQRRPDRRGGKGNARVRAAGPVALRLKLTRAGRALLASPRPPKLRLAVEFRGADGRRSLRAASFRLT
jgi:hypothetical protein